jgi:hypothetical protein
MRKEYNKLSNTLNTTNWRLCCIPPCLSALKFVLKALDYIASYATTQHSYNSDQLISDSVFLIWYCQSGKWTGCTVVTSAVSCQYHATNLPHSFIPLSPTLYDLSNCHCSSITQLKSRKKFEKSLLPSLPPHQV